MTTAQAIAASNPSQGELRATAAFQGPGVSVSTTTKPRHYPFDPEDKPPLRKGPYIPAKYRGRMFDDNHGQTLQQKAEFEGLETVEIILPEKLAEADPNRTDWGVIGIRGAFLKPGDRQEMPVGHAMQLVENGQAVFVLSSSTAQEEKQIAELEAKGYQFATTTKPAREREEFQKIFKHKRSKWMDGALNPNPLA